jgi:hypothetical protein
MKPLTEEFSTRLVDLAGNKPGLRVLLPVKMTVPAEGQGDTLDMVASDETIDRYNECIKADGWVLDNYQRNPVIQNSHQYGDLLHTIGKAVSTAVVKGQLQQRWQFATDVNPIAKIAYGLYKGGFLNASSVGFVPIEWTNGSGASDRADAQGEPVRTYTKSELLEVSAVGIPANPNALVMGLKAGAIDKSDLKELASLLKTIYEAEPRPISSPAETDPNARSAGIAINAEQWNQLSKNLQDIRAILKRA